MSGNKRLIFALFILLGAVVFRSSAQTGSVTGKVTDATTGEPLPFANVFINQTTIGTASDEKGRYVLNKVPIGENTIVCSFIGYKSRLQKIRNQGGEETQWDFSLEPDEKQLETVEVTGTRDKEWEKQVRKFENSFLGDTKFASSSRIKNPWVIDFREGNNLFLASSTQPIEVENMALGYRLFYYLQRMVTSSSGYSINGEVRFEELHSDDPKQIRTWNQNRLQAYKGSLRHLMKSILDGKVKEEGFNLYTDVSGYEGSPYRSDIFSEQLNKTIQPLTSVNVVRKGNDGNEFIIELSPRVEIHYIHGRSTTRVYHDISSPVSWLQVKEGYLRVNANGVILSPPFAVVSGAMYEDRVANLLPYDYSPNLD